LSEKAIFETTMGDFEFEFYRDKAPKTVEAIVDYIKEGFYDNTLIHRVVKGFVVQAGIYDLEMNKKDKNERPTQRRGIMVCKLG